MQIFELWSGLIATGSTAHTGWIIKKIPNFAICCTAQQQNSNKRK